MIQLDYFYWRLSMDVIVVGGGIAGLTTSLALSRKGIGVTLIEQAQAFQDIGAGIQIGSNGTVVMRELGLEKEIAACGVVPASWDTRDLETGRLVFETPLGTEAGARYGGLLYNIHRADLIGILAAAQPFGVVRLASRCVEVGQSGERAWIRLEGGETLEADAVIAADGIHSVARRQLFGADEIQSSKMVMWRALISGDKMANLNFDERGHNWVGPGRTIVSYWVRPKRLFSILATVPELEVTRESWTESGDIADLRKSFTGVEPRLQGLLDSIDTAFITGMYYRNPIESWTGGRVALLGDAAHPMVPFLAQGACQGMEDAWVVATTLANCNGDVPAAFAEYEARRKPRTTRIQAGARAMVKIVHETDRDRIRTRNGRWKGMSRVDPFAESSWGAGWKYNVLEEVGRPPGEVYGLSATKEGHQLLRSESRRAYAMLKNAVTPEDAAQGHDGLRAAYDRFLIGNFPPDGRAKFLEGELGSVPTIRVIPRGENGDSVILHFHGGGYVFGSAKSSKEYASRLAEALGSECYVVDYRLAPEHAYPAAIDDAVEAYRALVKTGVPASKIILSGESSGAGLATALAMSLRTAGDELPAGIVAICPFADLTLGSESIALFNGTDPAANKDSLVLMASSYFQGHDPADPLVSPVLGDFRSLPPFFIAVGNNEVLRDDALRMASKARSADVDVILKQVDDTVHVFPLFAFLPETGETLREIALWAGHLLAKQNS
jgi:salicylate hydroxylase